MSFINENNKGNLLANSKTPVFWILILLAGIILLTAILYVPQTGIYFDRDDDGIILYRAMLNSWRIQLSPIHILDVFRFEYFPMHGCKPDKYRPVHNIAALLLFALFGATPLPYHIFTLMCHLGTAILLWRFARHMGLSPPIAIGAALGFLVFFAGAEVAVRFSTFPESLACMLGLASLNLLISAIKTGGFWRWILFIVLMWAATLTKVSAYIFLPALLLIIWRAKQQKSELPALSLPWCWIGISACSLFFALLFFINAKVQPAQIQFSAIEDTSPFSLGLVFLARPFMNLFPISYPLPNEVFLHDWTFWFNIAGGFILLLAAIWRILKGTWLERLLWIWLYFCIIHTIVLPPNARYEYSWGIPACILLAIYLYGIVCKLSAKWLKAVFGTLIIAVIAGQHIIIQQIINQESRDRAISAHTVQNQIFGSMTPTYRHPFEKQLLVKKYFLPVEVFLYQTYLYPPYRDEVEKYYDAKLPEPSTLGLPDSLIDQR